jgi:hypothetical protein
MENKNRVIQAIRAALRENTAAVPLSAMNVITVGMEELAAIRTMTGPEKFATLRAALNDIATGADGVADTSDDLVAPETMRAINQILDTGILGDVVDAVLKASRGEYDFGRVVEDIHRIDTGALWRLARPALIAFAGGLVWRFFFHPAA